MRAEEKKREQNTVLPPSAFIPEENILSEVVLPEGDVESDVVMAGDILEPNLTSNPSSKMVPGTSKMVAVASNSNLLEPATSNQLDLSGNHSSEEELEEIITACKRPYVDSRENKRKWTSELSQSETSCESDADGFEDPELRPQPVVGQLIECDRSTSASAGSSSCDTPSGDEEVNHNQPTPLKF